MAYLEDCFRMFSTSINKILLDAQISEHKETLSTRPNTYDIPQFKTSTKPMATTHLYSLDNNNPLYLVPQIYCNTLLTTTEHTSQPSYLQRSSRLHAKFHQANIDDTYEPI